MTSVVFTAVWKAFGVYAQCSVGSWSFSGVGNCTPGSDKNAHSGPFSGSNGVERIASYQCEQRLGPYRIVQGFNNGLR